MPKAATTSMPSFINENWPIKCDEFCLSFKQKHELAVKQERCGFISKIGQSSAWANEHSETGPAGIAAGHGYSLGVAVAKGVMQIAAILLDC